MEIVSAFAPLIISLLSGAVGALLVYFLTVYRDNRRIQAELDRELLGLMTLIFQELAMNRLTLKQIIDAPEFVSYTAFSSLYTDVWNDSKVRLASLLEREHTASLIGYYDAIRESETALKDEALSNEMKIEQIRFNLGRANKYARTAMWYSGQYLFKNHPDYTEDMHERWLDEARTSSSDE